MLIPLLLAAVLMLGGCFNLDIREDVDFPGDLFKETMTKINSIHARYPDRKGPVNNLNFLIYNGEDRQLIRFSVPKALMQTISHYAKDELKNEKMMKKYGGAAHSFDLEKLDMDALGPGLLIEIEVAEDNVHVLIWLD